MKRSYRVTKEFTVKLFSNTSHWSEIEHRIIKVPIETVLIECSGGWTFDKIKRFHINPIGRIFDECCERLPDIEEEEDKEQKQIEENITEAKGNKNFWRKNKSDKYFLLIEGVGEGCDYTIGCNILFKKLDVKSMIAAKKRIMDELDTTEYASLKIVEAKEVFELDIEKLEKTLKHASERDEIEDDKKDRKKLYDELKKEFG